MTTGKVGMTGNVRTKVFRAPGPGLRWKLKNMSRRAYIWGWLATGMGKALSKITGVPTLHGQLKAVFIGADGSRINYGVLCRRVVTTALAEFWVDQLQTETSVFGDFKFHDSGVGTTAAVIGDTDIETTDGESRATGTQTENGSKVYQSVGTIAYTTTKAITEHGLFSASTGVTLMDRHVFSAINVDNGDSVQFTYDLTISDGG